MGPVDRLGGRIPLGLGEQAANALQEVRRHLVTATLVPEQFAEPTLEVRVIHARSAPSQVLLDVGVNVTLELPVEVELYLFQHPLTVNLRQDLAPLPFPTTPFRGLFFHDAGVT
jgi:hypothetical protein